MKTRLQRLAFLILFAGLASSSAQAQLLVDQNDVGCSDVTGTPYCTIQAAVNAATAGQTVSVAPGTYIENVTINKNLTLFSTSGRAVTTIQGLSSVGSLGAVVVTGGTSGVQIGGVGQGFTIVGIDNGAPGVENAAVYFQSSHSNAVVRDNEVVANGDHGLVTEFGATISGFIIDDNEFSGQTFLGAMPGGCGFGSQFTTPNVPRQLVVMGGGFGGGNTSNVTFTNNQVTGTAGGPSTVAGCTTFGQGNTLATLDANTATITGNTFAGTTARFATSLRTRGPSTTISGNSFDSSGLILPFTGHVFIQNIGVNLSTVAGANTFDKGVYVDGPIATIGLIVGAFVAAVPGTFPAGSTINVLPGTYVESSQIHVTADLDLVGTNRATTLIKPGFDTGSSGDPRGFFLVDSGVTFNLTEVTIDGTGRKVWQAIRTRGQGTISNVDFVEIKFNESGPHYSGVGMAAFGSNVDVTNSTFTEMGRIGVLYFGAGITGSVFSGNTYTGKGVGDFLDYALDISAGAVVTVEDNTISGNRGVASVDGSTSAGILVTTFFALGTTSTITDNDLSDNTTGIAVGFNASDASTVTATFNNITGNDTGISTTNPLVDGTCNWWGDADGPSGAGPGAGDPVDTGVTFNPWLLSPAPSTCFALIARFEKQLARDGLAVLLPTGDSKNDKKIEKAIKALDKSLDPDLWVDPNHPDEKDGHKVFNEEKKAVKSLLKVMAPPDVSAFIDALVLADETLAQIAIDEVDCSAASNPKDEEKCQKELDKANEEMAKAADDLADGKPDKAIDHYKKAWEHALKALKKIGAPKRGEDALEAPVVAAEVPSVFSLEQNYPNPFNPVTTIRYAVPEAAYVRVRVFNVLGQEVARLVDRVQEAGSYDIRFDASHLSSGAYFYVMEAAGYQSSKMMVLVK